MQSSHESEHTKTDDLTDYQLTSGSFLLAITFMWSDLKIPGWPQFFQQELFPSEPSLVDFNRAIIFRSFHVDFLNANLAMPIISCLYFQIFAAPVVWSILEIAVQRPPRLVSIVQSFLNAFSSSSRVQIWLQRCAWSCLGQVSQSIENQIHYDLCHAVYRPGLFPFPRFCTSSPRKVRKRTFPHGISNFVGSLEKFTHRKLSCLQR